MSASAGSVMTTAVVTVNENAKIQEAIELISKHKFSGLLVTDNDENLVGILSETDILKYSHKDNIVPLVSLSGWVSPHTEITDIATIRKGIELLSHTEVKKVMTRKIISVTKETPVVEIARLMNKKNVNRIPVLDDNNKVAGIVTRADLIRSMGVEK